MYYFGASKVHLFKDPRSRDDIYFTMKLSSKWFYILTTFNLHHLNNTRSVHTIVFATEVILLLQKMRA